MDWDDLFKRFLVMNMVAAMNDKTCIQQREIVQTAVDNTMETAKCISEIERLFSNAKINEGESIMDAPKPLGYMTEEPKQQPQQQQQPETRQGISEAGLMALYNDLTEIRVESEALGVLMTQLKERQHELNKRVYESQLELYKLFPGK